MDNRQKERTTLSEGSNPSESTKKNELKLYECVLNGDRAFTTASSPAKAYHNFRKRGEDKAGKAKITDFGYGYGFKQKHIPIRFTIIKGKFQLIKTAKTT